MPLIQIILVLIVIGVLLWIVNGPAVPYIWPRIIKIINIVAVVGIVLWLVGIFWHWIGWGWIDPISIRPQHRLQ